MLEDCWALNEAMPCFKLQIPAAELTLLWFRGGGHWRYLGFTGSGSIMDRLTSVFLRKKPGSCSFCLACFAVVCEKGSKHNSIREHGEVEINQSQSATAASEVQVSWCFCLFDLVWPLCHAPDPTAKRTHLCDVFELAPYA